VSGNGGRTPWVVTVGAGYSTSKPAEQYVLIQPKRGATGRLVLWHHGVGGETQFVVPGWATTATPGTSDVRANLHNNLLAPLIDRGYTVLSCDFGGGATFGNDPNLARIDDALTFAAAKGLTTTRVGLLGESMGSASVFLWASRHLAKVAAIATYLTIGDWDYVYAHNIAGQAAAMDTAYTSPNTPVGGWTANSPTRNPTSEQVYGQLVAAGLAAHWRGYYASDDPIGTPAQVIALASLLGVPDHAIDLGAGGHTDAPLATVDALDFAGTSP
jgi:pimeloyl-ACP methyl ester carboxylesterase